MRDCKAWLDLPRFHGGKIPMVSMQTLRDVIRRELAAAPSRDVLDHRTAAMYESLRHMFERDELNARSYSSIRAFLRTAYEARWTTLLKKEVRQ